MSEQEREVARLLLPLPVRGLDRLSAYLENAYGKDLTMRQEGQWMIVERPA